MRNIFQRVETSKIAGPKVFTIINNTCNSLSLCAVVLSVSIYMSILSCDFFNFTLLSLFIGSNIRLGEQYSNRHVALPGAPAGQALAQDIRADSWGLQSKARTIE